MPHIKRRAWLVLGACPLVGVTRAVHADEPLRGAGATFPAPVYERWSAAYELQTGQALVYDEVGSGRGIERLERGVVDFGASDRPLDRVELKKLDAWQFPTMIGGVVPVVNLRGIAPGDLKLTGEVIARIYLGDIRSWKDPALAALNPGLALPSENITVVHREDVSGTSFLWSEFLARKSPEWRARIGSGPELPWPVGVAESGNDGVASMVQRTRASLGYVEYAYARRHGLSDASIRNRAGRFVQASQGAFAAAAGSAAWRTLDDLVQVLVDQGGPASWPIVGLTFIVLPRHPVDPVRQRALFDFFRWALVRGGADVVSLDYVPLPAPAASLIEAAW